MIHFPLSGGSSPSSQGDILDIGCLGGISLQLGLIQQITFQLQYTASKKKNVSLVASLAPAPAESFG